MILTYEKLQDINLNNFAQAFVARFVSRTHDEGGIRKHFAMPDSREASRVRTPLRTFDPSTLTFINLDPEPEKGQIGTAGFDLRVGRLIAEVDTVIDGIAEEGLRALPHKILEPGEEYVLQCDPDGSKVYYVTSFEKIRLSQDLEILVDSKSTSGRVGAMSHGIGALSSEELVTIIQPYAFPLKVRCGTTKLSQAAVRYKGTPYMTNEEVLESEEIKFTNGNSSLKDHLDSRGLLMRFDIPWVYKARKCDEPIDMDAKGLDSLKYFEKLDGANSIRLDKKTLYLLGSQGVIGLGGVCGLLSREEDVLTGTGTWGHFAGIFQPFFRGGITMEVYSHSKKEITRGSRAGSVRFDRVEGVKERPADYGGTYQGQIPPLLPKMFKQVA